MQLRVVIYKKWSDRQQPSTLVPLSDRDAVVDERLSAEFLPTPTTLRLHKIRRRSKAIQVSVHSDHQVKRGREVVQRKNSFHDIVNESHIAY